MLKKRAIPTMLACTSGLLVLVPVGTVAANRSCDSLLSLRLADATITSAFAVPLGASTFLDNEGAPHQRPLDHSAPAELPTFCRVQATALTEIKIEVWLPASGWNGNFEAIGIGGKAGIIPYANMATALKDGYATASTDTGHNKSQGELCVRRCPKCTRGKTENLTLGA